MSERPSKTTSPIGNLKVHAIVFAVLSSMCVVLAPLALALRQDRQAINLFVLAAVTLVGMLLAMRRHRKELRGEFRPVRTLKQVRRQLVVLAVVFVAVSAGVVLLARWGGHGMVGAALLATVLLASATGVLVLAVTLPERMRRPDVQERYRRLLEERRRASEPDSTDEGT